MNSYIAHSKYSKPVFAFLLLICALFPIYGQEATDLQESQAGKVWIIPIRGNIEPSMSTFVRREARKAMAENAQFIVFEIDTFGGRVDSSLQIASFIMSIRGARTVAWVHNSEQSLGVSWSAGALIAFACTDIYMANGTSIGAAAPVTVGADGSAAASGEKTVAAIRSQMAALAERNGHPKGIALAMVDLDVELWEVMIDGSIQALTREEIEILERNRAIERVSEISPRGKLLSLTAGEAYRYGLTRGITDELDDLLEALGAAGGTVVESNPSVADEIITFLTSAPIQTILIVLGLVLIFLELSTPGFGIPGTVAIVCFALVFGSSALLGQVGSLELILFLLGIALLAVEIFVLPGFGVVGFGGIILIGFSLIFSMQDFIIPRFDWEWGILGRNAAVVTIGMVTSIAGIAVLALMGPKFKLFDRLTLKARITGTAGGPDPDASILSVLEESDGEINFAVLLGKEGTTSSALRTSGRAEIEGRTYSVETEGDFIDSGKAIKVAAVRGNRIIVRRL